MSKKKTSTGVITFRPYLAAYIMFCIFLGLYTLELPLMIYMTIQSPQPVLYIIQFLGYIFILGCTHSTYKQSRLRITVNEECIIMENIKTKEVVLAKWTDFQGAYHLTIGNNGHSHILLLKEPLSYQEQKDLYHRFSRSKQQPILSLDGNIWLYPFTDHLPTILEYIINKIPYHAQANEPRIWF